MQTTIKRRFLNHPSGLYILALTAMWEYFSYYGMRALLVLYMSKEFLFTDNKAYSVYGAYGALVYVTTLLGAWLTKTAFGYRRSICLGAFFIALGNIMITVQHGNYFYLGLAIIICGNGLCKPNIVNLVGQLYANESDRRDSGFTLFYVGANLGGFIAPLVCGFVSVKYGWNWSFYVAGIGMILGLFIFILGRKHFAECDYGTVNSVRHSTIRQVNYTILILVLIPLVSWTIQHHLSGIFLNIVGIGLIVWLVWQMIKSNPQERNNMIVMFVLLLFGTIFWAFDMQADSSIVLFADRIVDRHIWNWTIPTPMFQSINPFVIFLIGPLLSIIWVKLQKHNINISAGYKFSLAFFQLGLGFLALVVSANLFANTGHTSLVWIAMAYFLISTGELCCEPIGLAAANNLFPKHLVGMIIAAWYLYTGSYANYVAAIIAKFTSIEQQIDLSVLHEASLKYGHVFGNIVISAMATGVVLLLISRFLLKKIKIE